MWITNPLALLNTKLCWTQWRVSDTEHQALDKMEDMFPLFTVSLETGSCAPSIAGFLLSLKVFQV
jgi:hypothetical protein